jgi:hybrid cluster-associated redox disulfide protein
MLVSEVMQRWPQTAAVFLRHRMNCIGCEMSVFEALSDAARIYDIRSEQFIRELEQAVLDGAANNRDRDPAEAG